MRSRTRTVLLALVAVVTMVVGASPASASPLDDFLDDFLEGLDLGSSGPATTGPQTEGDFLVVLKDVPLTTRVLFGPTEVSCLDTPELSPEPFTRDDSVLIQLFPVACERGNSFATFDLTLIARSGQVRMNTVYASLRSGSVSLFCLGSKNPAYTDANCTVRDDVVKFS